MATNDPLIYLEGFYNLNNDILENLDKYIGIPFKNETNNNRYDKLNGMTFGGPAEIPYIYFLKDLSNEQEIIWPDNKKLKTGEIFARQDYIKKVILDIKPVNIFLGELARHNFDTKDFYLRFEGTVINFENTIQGNYNWTKN